MRWNKVVYYESLKRWNKSVAARNKKQRKVKKRTFNGKITSLCFGIDKTFVVDRVSELLRKGIRSKEGIQTRGAHSERELKVCSVCNMYRKVEGRRKWYLFSFRV